MRLLLLLLGTAHGFQLTASPKALRPLLQSSAFFMMAEGAPPGYEMRETARGTKWTSPDGSTYRDSESAWAAYEREAAKAQEEAEVGLTTLYAKMLERGKGQALIFHMEDMRAAFAEADADGDGYIGVEEMSTLLASIGDTDNDGAAAIATIEREQTIDRKGDDGASLVYFEQFVKFENDAIGLKINGPEIETGFKLPWQ